METALYLALVALAVSVLMGIWLYHRLCICVSRLEQAGCEERVFFFSQKHADELIQWRRHHLSNPPCGRRIAVLDDGTMRPYTCSFPVAGEGGGKGMANYRRHFPDAQMLGRGRDLGAVGWWR